jgi:hypothetical protein
MNEGKRWLRISAASRQTGIADATIQSALNEKRLKGRKKEIRGTRYKIWLIDADALAEFAAAHKSHPRKRSVNKNGIRQKI